MKKVNSEFDNLNEFELEEKIIEALGFFHNASDYDKNGEKIYIYAFKDKIYSRKVRSSFPDWARSLDSALLLLDDDPSIISFRIERLFTKGIYPKRYLVYILPKYCWEVNTNAETIPIAICKAWLAIKKQEKERGI